MRLISLYCFAVCFLITCACADEKSNLIANGDFSQGLTGWNLTGTDETQSSVVPVEGQTFKQALQIVVKPKPGKASQPLQLQAPSADIQFGKYYEVTVWARSADPAVALSLQVAQPGKNFGIGTTQTLTEQWRQVYLLLYVTHFNQGQDATFPFTLSVPARPVALDVADFRVSEVALPVINPRLTLRPNDEVLRPNLDLQIGHTDGVNSIAVFPDRKRIATSSWDGAIKVWDIATQQLVRTNRNKEMVERIKVSQDGRFLAATLFDYGIALYRADNGVLLKRIADNNKGGVNDIIFSADSTRLIAAGKDGSIKVWNLLDATPEQVTPERVLAGHTDMVNSLAFSPDGKILASASNDKSVKLWNWTKGNLIKTFNGFDDAVNGVDISPDGSLVVASEVTSFKLLDLVSGETKRQWSVVHDMPRWNQAKRSRVHFSPDGKRIVGCATKSKNVFVWYTATGNLVAEKSMPPGQRNDAAFSIDGKSIFSVVGNNSLHWDCTSGKTISEIGPPRIEARLSQSSDGRYCRASSETLTSLWNLDTGCLENNAVFPAKDEYRTDEWSNHNGANGNETAQRYKAISAMLDTQILVTDVTSGRPRTVVDVPKGSAKMMLSVSPNGKRMVTGGMDGALWVYELPSWRLLATMTTLPSIEGNSVREWITTTPDGYYNCSPEAARFIKVNIGTEFYPVESFAAKYYRPDLVERSLAGEMLPPPEGFKGIYPPQLRLATNDTKTDTGTVTVTIHVEDDSAVQNIAFFVNGAKVEASRTETREDDIISFTPDGRPLTSDSRPLTSESRALTADARPLIAESRPLTAESRSMPIKVAKTMTFRVPVPAGSNAKLQVLAFDDDGLQSPRQELFFTPAEKGPTALASSGRLLGLCVGVSRYQHEKLNLRFASNDALELTKTLKAQHGLYRAVQVKSITDQEATRPLVTIALDQLIEQVTRDDTVVLLLAGHGWRDQGRTDNPDSRNNGRRNFFFATTDIDPKNIAATALPWGDIVSRLGKLSAKSRRVIVLLDACHSGSAAGNEDLVKEIVYANAGVIVLASSRGSEVSLESADWQHGAFTKAIIDAVSGEREAGQGEAGRGEAGRGEGQAFKGKALSVWDFANHVKKRVEALTEDRQHPQVPFLSDFDTDAPILAVGR